MKNNIFFDEINDHIENIRVMLAESLVNPSFSRPITYDTLLKEFQNAYLILIKNKAFFETHELPEAKSQTSRESSEKVTPVVVSPVVDVPVFKEVNNTEVLSTKKPETLPDDRPLKAEKTSRHAKIEKHVEQKKSLVTETPEKISSSETIVTEPIVSEVNVSETEISPVVETIVPKPVIPSKNKTNTEQNISLADKFRTEDNSLNHRFGKADKNLLGEIAKLNPLSDIRQGIGINDRFMFVRELFVNDSEKYNQTIEALNTAGSIENALAVINRDAASFAWQEENETVQKLILLVYRRYKQ